MSLTTPTKLYISLKCIFLFGYYSLLYHLGFGLSFKFWSFMITTPIVKYFYFNKLSTPEDRKTFIASIIVDFFSGIIYFHYLLPLEGVKITLYLIGATLLILAGEYFQYLFLGSPDESFEVKLSPRITDYLLVPVFTLSFLIMGLYLPTNLPYTPFTFVFWILNVYLSDFIFGFTHYFSHTNPQLKKLHLVHHEYRKEHLNTMANYYAELLDSFIMNTTAVVFAIMTILCGENPIGLKELIFCGAHSHHKYPKNQMSLRYFFEWDLIDMIFDRVRLTNWHNIHHNLSDQNFSIFGLVSDDIIKQSADALTRSKRFLTALKNFS